MQTITKAAENDMRSSFVRPPSPASVGILHYRRAARCVLTMLGNGRGKHLDVERAISLWHAAILAFRRLGESGNTPSRQAWPSAQASRDGRKHLRHQHLLPLQFYANK